MGLWDKVWGDTMDLSIDQESVCAGGVFVGTLTYKCTVSERKIARIRLSLAFMANGNEQTVAEKILATDVGLREGHVWTQRFELAVPDTAIPSYNGFLLIGQAEIDGAIDGRAWKEVQVTAAPRAVRWPPECCRCGAPFVAPAAGSRSLRCEFCGTEHPVEVE